MRDAVTTATALAAAGTGFKAPTISEFDWPCVTPSVSLLGQEACVNRVGLLTMLAAALVGGLFLMAFLRPKIVPGRLQSAMELAIFVVRDQIVLPVAGQPGLRFVPYLTTVFWFIFVGNAFGVTPGINYPVTASVGVTLVLALSTWILFNAVGMKEQGVGGYLRSVLFPPGVPWPLYILITPIEIISTLVLRPLTLTIRLVANMIAGHLLLVVFLLGTYALFQQLATAPLGAIALAISVALIVLKLLVAFIQAYIFTILTTVYLAGAVEPEH